MELRDRIKQFGYISTLKTAFKALVRPVFKISEFEVLVINNHKSTVINNSVRLISIEKLIYWKEKNEISAVEYKRFFKFINNHCIGYYIEIENRLAAWGFVQTNGQYKYGNSFYQIPNNVNILKNLFVKPEYRGMSLGKFINETRVGNISSGSLPCVFVIPENRYAIRNLKKVGFENSLRISQYILLKKYTKTVIKKYTNNTITDLVVSGFNKSKNNND